MIVFVLLSGIIVLENGRTATSVIKKMQEMKEEA